VSQTWLPRQRPSAPVDFHLTHDSLGPSEPITQAASRSIWPFLQSSLQNVPILYNGTPFSPSKLSLPMGDPDPPSNTWFPGPTQVVNPNGISIGAAVFAGLTSVTDRQTDRQTDSPRYSVGNNRLHMYVVLRCDLIITVLLCNLSSCDRKILGND